MFSLGPCLSFISFSQWLLVLRTGSDLETRTYIRQLPPAPLYSSLICLTTQLSCSWEHYGLLIILSLQVCTSLISSGCHFNFCNNDHFASDGLWPPLPVFFWESSLSCNCPSWHQFWSTSMTDLFNHADASLIPYYISKWSICWAFPWKVVGWWASSLR